METGIVISQIIILGVVVIIGAIAAKAGVLTQDANSVISKVIFNISLPLMLFSNFLKLEATPRLLANSAVVLSVSGFIIAFMLMAGWLTTRIFRIKGREGSVFRAHSMFGNTIFLGFPLINALYGVEGLLYASMYQLVSTIIMWTAGVVVLTHGDGSSWKKSFARILNPNTIATMTGLVFFVFSIKLPEVILKPLSELGSANTWLSMLYIGAMLVLADVGGLLKKKSIYILSFNRLVLIPLILIFSFAAIGSFTGQAADKMVAAVIILEASMPCMASVVIMAKELGADDHLAVGNVFISTLISTLTLPAVVMMINRLL